MSLLEAALDYAARGFPVLPLEPSGKAPVGRLVRHGSKDATKDAATIRERWRSEPAANVGIRTGDGLAVLDVDPRDGGAETLDAYLDNLGTRLPVTAEVATGGNGWHHFFSAPAGVRCARLGPGLDLKAEGGYVVAPPSVHANGRLYAWHPARTLGDVKLAALPAWLARANSSSQNGGVASADEWANLVCHGVAEGQRNTSTARLAGRLLARGLGVAETFGLLEAWDLQRNRPPLGSEEVEKVVASIAERDNRKRRREAA